MASFCHTADGQQVEFQRVLASAGFTDSDIARVIKEPDLASTMYASIQPMLGSSMPPWWRTPEQQLARARQLWPNAVLPEPPAEFTPRTESEVLLLHVPDTFDNLWNLVKAPTGYTKNRKDGVKSNSANLRLAPSKVEFTAPVWLAFDPEHGNGESPEYFWGQANIAASEVFSALIQFPGWSLAWFNGASAPSLTGYQLKYAGWSHVPRLSRWSGELKLCSIWASWQHDCWASPSVREC